MTYILLRVSDPNAFTVVRDNDIQWTTHTFNPWRGGPNGSRVVASESMWLTPHQWNKDAKNTGDRHRVFCASLADVFEWQGPMVDGNGDRLYWPNDSWNEKRKWVPDIDCGGDEKPVTMPDVRNRLFDLIDATPHLDWLLLRSSDRSTSSKPAPRWLSGG